MAPIADTPLRLTSMPYRLLILWLQHLEVHEDPVTLSLPLDASALQALL